MDEKNVSSDDSPVGSGDGPTDKLREAIVEVLKSVYDPEIPVDIYELGLIYGVDINESHHVKITMTLTSPMCPVAESLPVEVEQKVGGVEGVDGAEIDLVWDPPWDPSRMSEAARLQLGM